VSVAAALPDRAKRLAERARLIRLLRDFLDQRGLIEVQTPLISEAGVTDVHIESVRLADRQGYLRTSPEYAHKRLLAEGLGDLYELGPVFRAGESGRMHRLEFTLLEWYRRGFSWQELAQETIDLCQHALAALGQSGWQARWYDWADCFTRAGLPDPLEASDGDIRRVSSELPSDCDRDMRLDWLFSTSIQARFPDRTLTVVHGYPASQAALSRLDGDDPRKAQRFELFAGSIELANGYQELTDAREQRRRFEQDNLKRRRLGRVEMPIDEAFLSALEAGLPECAGVALGVDRLAMVALGQKEIGQVRAF
jgi:lysyl-tRNA synthetase class 2